MQGEPPNAALTEALASALRDLGFMLAANQFRGSHAGEPREAGLRAVRGHCEVHFKFSGESIHLGIPVVRLAPERPLTALLSGYLTDRNASGKGPGAFYVESNTVWYKAVAMAKDPACAAGIALSMQKKIGRASWRGTV